MTVINVLLWIWSHSPFFALSDDDNFATLDCRKKSAWHLRISIINIMLGNVIIYLITFDLKNHDFSLMRKMCLQDMKGLSLDDDVIAKLKKKYENHLDSIRASDWDIEKESLCYHIQIEEQRINRSIEKINIYATIILTVLPLLLAVLNLKKIMTLSGPLLWLSVFVFYSLINIVIYVFSAIKVGAMMRSRFADLKSSVNIHKAILTQYYFDWQQLRYKAELFVSFVLNLQEWVITVLVLSLFLSIGISFNNTCKASSKLINQYEMVETIERDQLEKAYSKSSIIWAEMVTSIEKKEYTKIIFVVNDKNYGTYLSEKLDKYDKLEIKVVVDDSLDNNIIKIIKEIE